MLYTRLAIAAGAVILAVAGFDSPVGADQPEHREYAGAGVGLIFEDAPSPASLGVLCREVIPFGSPVCTVGISFHYAPSGWTDGAAVIDASEFTIDKSLSSASVTATMDGVTCENYFTSPPCTPTTISVNVQWTAVGQPINYPLPLFKKEEDCSATLGHSITREAVASGTVTIQSGGAGNQFTSVGSTFGNLGRTTFPQGDDTWCHAHPH